MPAIAATKPRSMTLDALRAWAIMLVILGHGITNTVSDFDSNYLFRLIYSFHMPLLMMVSGYLAFGKVEGRLWQVVRRKALALLIPYALWGLIEYAAFPARQSIGVLQYLVKLVEAPSTGLWFLWVLYFEFVALSLVTTLAGRHRVAVLIAVMVVWPILPAPSIFGYWDMTMYFPYFAGGWLLRHNGKARSLIEGRWLGPVSLCVFLVAAWFWSRVALPGWLPLSPGVAQNIIWKSFKYLTAGVGIAANTWLLVFVLQRVRSLETIFAWIGRRTIDVYASAGYFFYPLVALLAPYALPSPVAIALLFIVAFAGSLGLSVLVLRRFVWTRRLLLGCGWTKSGSDRGGRPPGIEGAARPADGAV